MRLRQGLALLATLAAACGGARRPTASPAPQAIPVTPPSVVSGSGPVTGAEAGFPPSVAFRGGYMPLASTGVVQFWAAHPTYDGRGVLMGILDSGVDPGVLGLTLTSTGAPKILDLRDFSGEGAVPLVPVVPARDGTVQVGRRKLTGTGRIARIASAATWYAGELREATLGMLPGADLNGNGTNTDVFPVIVVRATDGWVAFLDTNLNGSFDDETPIHDYREGRETLALGSKPLTMAANFAEAGGVPTLDFVFDNSGHGTHVAGIAAGNNLFGVSGFDGVAPGAQVLALKISNNARGGVSVTGSMARAMAYAARFAEARGLPLVLNLSFGVGNEFEGRAVIDSIVNAFLLAHPSVVFAISAGNDGPGLSTLGFPASADLALSAGAAFPGAFARSPHALGPRPSDVMGWWSSRGGELAKPDVVAPGMAFSTVPPFDAGDEFKGGTSMAAPYAAGLAACLMSGMVQEGRHVSSADITQSLRTSATRFGGATILDQGAGEPQLEAAYRWLAAGHQGSTYLVRASADGEGGGSAAFRRDGRGPEDSVDVFQVRHVAGLRAAQFLLRTSAPWLSAPALVTAAPLETPIAVRYSGGALAPGGVYVGSVTAWNVSDTLAGPLFTLVTTTIVPHDLARGPLRDDHRVIGPARVQRYFLRALGAGGTLHVTVTLPDSLAEGATARLYEPSGQPFRDAEEVVLGHQDAGTARFVVRSEDLVPGVYELDVYTPPLTGATVAVRAELAPLVLGERDGRLELENPGARTLAARAAVTVLGAVREFAIVGRGAAPETVTTRVPEWAANAVIEVEMPRSQWNEFTGFAVTEFDSSGQQVAQGPLNYAFGRQPIPVPGSLKRRPLVIELYPAFARPDGAHPWRATLRVRYLLDHPQTARSGGELSVVAGGRIAVAVGSMSLPSMPDGFFPLAEVRVRPANGAGREAVRWVAAAAHR